MSGWNRNPNQESNTMNSVRWFCGQANVGIVRVDDPYDGIVYRIGVAPGLDEQADIQHITDWGSTFPKEVGAFMFGDK